MTLNAGIRILFASSVPFLTPNSTTVQVSTTGKYHKDQYRANQSKRQCS